MKLKPLFDKLVVKRFEQETISPSGIIVTSFSTEETHRGEVLAVGPGKNNADGTFIPTKVNVGDIILFSSRAGQDVKIDGITYLILQEVDVLAIVS